MRLEEAISLCRNGREDPAPAVDSDAHLLLAHDLRRKRDILVASGGARVRFSRKGGIRFVDRARDVNSENCILFEDRRDLGDLDGFVPDLGERPRLFNPGFLRAVELEQGAVRDRLLLRGRLGRRTAGFPAEITIEGRKHERFVRIAVRVRNVLDDHRLRIRFLSLGPASDIGHLGTPGWEAVEVGGRRFTAATIVRACGVLKVGEDLAEVPSAQCRGWVGHSFFLGGDPGDHPT